jgi:hypothetical protein
LKIEATLAPIPAIFGSFAIYGNFAAPISVQIKKIESRLAPFFPQKNFLPENFPHARAACVIFFNSQSRISRRQLNWD